MELPWFDSDSTGFHIWQNLGINNADQTLWGQTMVQVVLDHFYIRPDRSRDHVSWFAVHTD